MRKEQLSPSKALDRLYDDKPIKHLRLNLIKSEPPSQTDDSRSSKKSNAVAGAGSIYSPKAKSPVRRGMSKIFKQGS